jgi:hypothetical protein
MVLENGKRQLVGSRLPAGTCIGNTMQRPCDKPERSSPRKRMRAKLARCPGCGAAHHFASLVLRCARDTFLNLAPIRESGTKLRTDGLNQIRPGGSLRLRNIAVGRHEPMHCFAIRLLNASISASSISRLRWRLTLSSHKEAVWRVTTAS